jgi:hypothetical protein
MQIWANLAKKAPNQNAFHSKLLRTKISYTKRSNIIAKKEWQELVIV